MIGLFTLLKYCAHLHRNYCEWKWWVNCKYLSCKSKSKTFLREKTPKLKKKRTKKPQSKINQRQLLKTSSMKNNYTLRKVSWGHCISRLIDPPCQLKFLQLTERAIPTELRKISLKPKGQDKVLLLPRSLIAPPFSFQKFSKSWDFHSLTK